MTNGNHNHTDNRRAAVHHQHQQVHARIRNRRHELDDTNTQIFANGREFGTHCNAHDIEYCYADGLEEAVFPIHSQLDTASHYRLAAYASMIVAIIFAIWFSSNSFVVEDPLWLYVLATIISIIVGVCASLLVQALFDARPLNPAAIRKLNWTLVIAGLIFAILLGLFLWVRFVPDSPLADYIAHIMTGIELSALVFSGTCDAAYRLYRWSGKLHAKHRHLLRHKAAHEDALAAEETTLADLEARVTEHHDSEPHHDHATDNHHGSSSSGHAPNHTGGHSRHTENHHDTVHATA